MHIFTIVMKHLIDSTNIVSNVVSVRKYIGVHKPYNTPTPRKEYLRTAYSIVIIYLSYLLTALQAEIKTNHQSQQPSDVNHGGRRSLQPQQGSLQGLHLHHSMPISPHFTVKCNKSMFTSSASKARSTPHDNHSCRGHLPPRRRSCQDHRYHPIHCRFIVIDNVASANSQIIHKNNC